MIPRLLLAPVQKLATQYPVVTIIGPRQSGKSTLCQMAFPELPVINLERPDHRARIASDPLAFVALHKGGCVIDEIQHLPELASYIQVAVDERKSKGEFILTGSHQLQLMESISTSLAGRTAIVKLLPLSFAEMQAGGLAPESLDQLLFTGGYPRICADKLEPTQALSFYMQTYIDRDVRTFINVRDLSQFEKFLRLCASRAGQLLNATSLGNEAGIDQSTVQRWMSVLEASFIIFRLPSHHNNLSKRIIKAPKFYFYDTGLLCFLLSLRSALELTHHPLRGQVFENFVASEIIKKALNTVQEPDLYFFRDRTGNEIDFLQSRGGEIAPIEAKASSTFSQDFLKGIEYYRALPGAHVCTPKIVYGGTEAFTVQGVEVLPWSRIAAV